MKRWRRTPDAATDDVALDVKARMELLGPLVKEAGASRDSALTERIGRQIRQSILELMPAAGHPLVSGALVDQLRWFITLTARLPEPPWDDIAKLGLTYSAIYPAQLEKALAKARQPGRPEPQRQELSQLAYALMEAQRSVANIAAYAWHRIGTPAFAGQLIENLTGSLFAADRLTSSVRASTPDASGQAALAHRQQAFLERLPEEDLPVAQGLSAAEAESLYERYVTAQIARVLELPRHLRLLAAGQLNCAPNVAAIETGRDIVYFVPSFRGSAAIRYRSDPRRAAGTDSVELGSLTTHQVLDWIRTATKVYRRYQFGTVGDDRLGRALARSLVAMGDHILEPILDAWPDLERFALVPVGTSAALPLYGAIVRGRPACVERDFTLAPNATSLHAASLFPAQPVTSALVAADPSDGDDYLPNTLDEAAAVAALYRTPVVAPTAASRPGRPGRPAVRALTAPPPSQRPPDPQLRARLTDGMTRPVVHFSCHGTISDVPELNAHLHLGGGLALNDFLGGGRPISPGGVVVLSACSVGGVVESVPTELFGFPAVLLGAGVRAVVAPTWPVLDTPETTTLMVALHRNLLAGMAPNRALADAIGASVRSGASCAVWGVFGVYGS